MIKRHIKRCSKLFIIRETQIKTTMKYHFILVSMVNIKMSTNNKFWRGCGEKGLLLHCWWKCKFAQPLWKAAWRFLRKLNAELPYDPATPFLGTHPKKRKAEHQRDICRCLVLILALCSRDKIQEQPKKPSREEGMDRMWPAMEYYSAVIKK